MADNSTTSSQKSADSNPLEEGHFSRLMDGLKDSVNEFQSHMTPENFARIISALGAMGFSGATLMRGTAEYVRRHPIQVALGVGLAFYALKGLLLADEARSLQTSQRGSTYH